MATPVDVLAAISDAADYVEPSSLLPEIRQAHTALAELFADVEPILRSLRGLITQDNAMEPQAVMVRRAWDSLMRCKGSQP